MLIRYPVFLCTFFLLVGEIIAGDTNSALPTSDELDAALQHVLVEPETPFHLQVNCTDQKGIRSFELFSGGATIWNRRGQIMLSTTTQSALLRLIIEKGFSEFKDSYGGRGRPAKKAAAARISCNIRIKIENLEKSSVQRADGEQSKKLTGLAAELLDQVERFADSAVIPDDLQDALDKLFSGQLALQCLRLRFVDLPARGKSEPGSILRLIGGEISRQAYSPGRAVAGQTFKSLGQEQFKEVVTELRHAQLASLPGNLWSEDQLELEVQVLAFKKVVLARPFTRFDLEAHESDQQRFDTLLLVLRKLNLGNL